MYQIKRNHIVEELEIEDNGKKLVLSVDINVDSILNAYNKANLDIQKATQQTQKAASDKDMALAEEAMGTAVLNLFEIIFGKEQTQKMLEFYDDHALEMLGDVVPFITEVVRPKIEESQQRIMDRYKQVSKRGK